MTAGFKGKGTPAHRPSHPLQAACTPGSKTGLLTYQCREWGKNTCYCPGLTTFNNFLTDTTCAVMTTPIVEGRTATVGECTHQLAPFAAPCAEPWGLEEGVVAAAGAAHVAAARPAGAC